MTAQLIPALVYKDWTANGIPLAFGTVTSYASGTTIPQATYVDSTLTTQNTNPTILNARGEANIWLDPSLSYKFLVQDSTGNIIRTVDNVNGNTFNQNLIPGTSNTYTLGSGGFVGSSWANLYLGLNKLPVLDTISGNIGYTQQSASELTASVTPVDYFYPVGDIRRYGAALDGVTDDTVAVKAWASVGGSLTWPIAKSALISAQIPLVSNTTITGCQGSTITSSIGGISFLYGNAVSNVDISDMTFINTGTTSLFPTTFAHVNFIASNFCTVRDCEFSGMNCGGVQFDGCTSCHADNNYFINGLYPTGQQQTFDIALFGYTGSTIGCTITNNKCFGGGNWGIGHQNAYSGFIPAKNVISGNRIGGSQLYGILVYEPGIVGATTAGNCFAQVIGNYIENIQGTSTLISGEGGAGIYVVGANAAGTVIVDNTIVNCCINTVSRGLAPAGIGISSTSLAVTFTGSVGGAATGTLNAVFGGPSGVYATQFSNGNFRQATYTNASATVSWTGNISAGSVVTANVAAANVAPITVASNNISSMTQFDGILAVSNLGGIAITGNTVNQPAANTTGYPLHIENSSFVTATGNVLINNGTAGSSVCVFVESPANSNCVNVTMAANNLLTQGANAFQATGTVQGCFLDKSNLCNGNIVNSSSGMVVHQLGAATPAAGTYQVGDNIFNTAPTSTGTLCWAVTTAGVVGTAVFTAVTIP